MTDQVDARTLEDMKDYIQHMGQCGAVQGVSKEGSFHVHEMSDEEVLDVIEQNGGYGHADGTWVDVDASSPAPDDHISMAPHGQWT